jgi:hypothetical protein
MLKKIDSCRCFHFLHNGARAVLQVARASGLFRKHRVRTQRVVWRKDATEATVVL